MVRSRIEAQSLLAFLLQCRYLQVSNKQKDIQRHPETKIISAPLSQGAVKGTRRHLFERPQLVCIGGKLGMVHSAIGAMPQQDIGSRKCLAWIHTG